MAAETSAYVLEMRDITKRFPGVLTLDCMNLKVRAASVHVLVGENGAKQIGKCTDIGLPRFCLPGWSGGVRASSRLVPRHRFAKRNRNGGRKPNLPTTLLQLIMHKNEAAKTVAGVNMAGAARRKLLHGPGVSRAGHSQPSCCHRAGRTSIVAAGRSGRRRVIAAHLGATMSRDGSLVAKEERRLVLQVDLQRADGAVAAPRGTA